LWHWKFSIEGIEPKKITNRLGSDHQIICVNTRIENIVGIRVSPHVFTTTKDLDKFVNAVIKIADLK
jgi:selenocysteine lyase/cysteine desulfurase